MRRPGFTMVELVVVLAILAGLAAVVLPQMLGQGREGRTAALAQSLTSLRESIYEYRADVRRYPTNLRYLSSQPSSANDFCGRNVPSSFLDEWMGPYTKEAVTADGIQLYAAVIQDTLKTEPASFSPGQAGSILVTVDAVDSLIADELEQTYDGESSPDFTDGTIRWTGTSAGQGTLEFALPIKGC